MQINCMEVIIIFFLTNENIKEFSYEVVTILGLLEFLNDFEIKKILMN